MISLCLLTERHIENQAKARFRLTAIGDAVDILLTFPRQASDQTNEPYQSGTHYTRGTPRSVLKPCGLPLQTPHEPTLGSGRHIGAGRSPTAALYYAPETQGSPAR